MGDGEQGELLQEAERLMALAQNIRDSLPPGTTQAQEASAEGEWSLISTPRKTVTSEKL